MSRFVAKPHLPQGKISHCIVSDQFDWVIDDLKNMGIEIIATDYLYSLQTPVAKHADMQCCHLGYNNIVVYKKPSNIAEKLSHLGVEIFSTSKSLSKQYPFDIALNCLHIKNNVVGKIQHLEELTVENKVKIDTKQGYTKCSCVVVDDNSVITADQDIAVKLQKIDIDVLKIRSSNIILPGYDYGFIGGCCGKIDKDKLYFTGDIYSHPDGNEMVAFAKARGVDIICGNSAYLVDVGSILPIIER